MLWRTKQITLPLATSVSCMGPIFVSFAFEFVEVALGNKQQHYRSFQVRRFHDPFERSQEYLQEHCLP